MLEQALALYERQVFWQEYAVAAANDAGTTEAASTTEPEEESTRAWDRAQRRH